MRSRTLLLSCFFISLICSCSSWFNAENTKRATCNELRSRMIFNGSTSDTQQANLDRAEQFLEQQNYEANNCDYEFMSLTPPQ